MTHTIPAPDADIVQITAYLAGEMTRDEILSVDDRLVTDAGFRDKVQPLIDVWQYSGSFSSTSSPTIVGRASVQPRRWGRALRAAAVVMIVVVSGAVVAQAVLQYNQRPRAATALAPTTIADNRAAVGLTPLVGAVGGSTATPQQLPTIRQLGPIEARFPLFRHGPNPRNPGRAPSIRQLSNGTVLVSDYWDRRLVLLDSTLTRLTVLLDTTTFDPTRRYPTGPTTTRQPHILAPYVGDSTLLVEGTGSYLVIGPKGENLGSLPTYGGRPTAIDRLGRSVAAYASPGRSTGETSNALLRFGPAGSVDTLTRVQVEPPLRAGPVGPQGQANPLAAPDDWAILSDGSVAVVRANDFHVDWFEWDGARRSTKPIPFDFVRLNAGRKQALVDSLRAYYERNPMSGWIGRMFTNGVPVDVPPLVLPSVLPDVAPPFPTESAIGDADNRLWIRVFTRGELPRSTNIGLPDTLILEGSGNNFSFQRYGPSLNPPTTPPVYYVIDKAGVVVDRVQLPIGWQILGFGAGGKIYLIRDQIGNGWEIVRARVR